MAASQGLGQAIREHGWHQGAAVGEDLKGQLFAEGAFNPPIEVPDESILLIVSQDCDLVHDDEDSEPHVEALLAIPATGECGNWQHGKNPRNYQFTGPAHANGILYNIRIHDKTRFARRYLASDRPDHNRSFSSSELRTLTHWVARRYTRPAFPNEFNRRIHKLEQKTRKKLKTTGRHIQSIYIHLNPMDELLPDQDYKLVLWGTVSVEDWNEKAHREEATKAFQEIESLLSDCEGLRLIDSPITSESEMSLDDRNQLYRWDFDDLTLRENDELSLPSDD